MRINLDNMKPWTSPQSPPTNTKVLNLESIRWNYLNAIIWSSLCLVNKKWSFVFTNPFGENCNFCISTCSKPISHYLKVIHPKYFYTCHHFVAITWKCFINNFNGWSHHHNDVKMAPIPIILCRIPWVSKYQGRKLTISN